MMMLIIVVVVVVVVTSVKEIEETVGKKSHHKIFEDIKGNSRKKEFYG